MGNSSLMMLMMEVMHAEAERVSSAAAQGMQ